MAFGLNRAELIGRLGAAAVNHLASGDRVANLSIATDESYIDRDAGGERVDKIGWHRIVTFQPGLVDMLAKNAKKGRLVYVAGKLQTRRWKRDGEDSDRFSTEILLVPGSRIQFLDRANGNGAAAPAESTLVATAGGKDVTDVNAVFARLDKATEKYSDMVLVHCGGSGIERIAAQGRSATTSIR